MLKIAGYWESTVRDTICACTVFTSPWLPACNFFLLLLRMLIELQINPSQQHLSSQMPISLAPPAFIFLFF